MEGPSWNVWDAAVWVKLILVCEVLLPEGEYVKEVVWDGVFVVCVFVLVVLLFVFVGWVSCCRWFV